MLLLFVITIQNMILCTNTKRGEFKRKITTRVRKWLRLIYNTDSSEFMCIRGMQY